MIKSCGKFCASALLAYNALNVCPRQNASARVYSAPKQDQTANRTSTAVCTAAAQATNARRIERIPWA